MPKHDRKNETRMQAAVRQTDEVLFVCMANLAIKAGDEWRAARRMGVADEAAFFQLLEVRLRNTIDRKFPQKGRRR